MAHRVKCPECNGCMAPIWVLPNRYYYCEFCRTYYAGKDKDLHQVPNPQLEAFLEARKGKDSERQKE